MKMANLVLEKKFFLIMHICIHFRPGGIKNWMWGKYWGEMV